MAIKQIVNSRGIPKYDVTSTSFQENQTQMSFRYYWEADEKHSYMDILFKARIPKYGWRMSGEPWFTVSNSTIENVKRESDGKWYFENHVTVVGPPIPKDEEIPEDEDGNPVPIMPWNLPIEGYAIETVFVEESLEHLWGEPYKHPTDPETVLSNKIAFRSSAGTELIGTYQRPLLGISFTYNVPKKAFKEEYQIFYRDKLNNAPIKIAGRTYRTGQVMITGLRGEPLKYDLGINGEGGFVDYWKISLSLTIDPNTWWRKFANISTFFRSDDLPGFTQIWATETKSKYVDPDTSNSQGDAPPERPKVKLYDYFGNEIVDEENKARTEVEMVSKKHYGSRDQMAMLNNTSLEAVSEPMFLFPSAKSLRENLASPTGPDGINLYFKRPTIYGQKVDCDGGILPLDRQTGRQYLGFYVGQKYYATTMRESARFGYWRPVALDSNGKYEVIWDPDADTAIDQKLIHETHVEGYRNAPIAFDKLYIPDTRGMRWDTSIYQDL